MTYAAIKRGLRGLVIDGCVRDSAAIISMEFPVFCRGTYIKGTSKDIIADDPRGLSIKIGGTSIHSGDVIFGDDDGVVVIPQHLVGEAIQKAIAIEAKEKKVINSIKNGQTTLEIFKLNGKKL